MACQICLSLTLALLSPLSNNRYNHRHRHHCIKPKALKQFHSQRNPNKDTTLVLVVVPPFSFTKRSLISASLALILNGFLPLNSIAELELQTYTDVDQGFTLLRPSSWIKVEKAGATVLFEEPNKGSNNVGVVVNPVRLDSLGQFGTPEFVADKLIQAEKRKESTKDAEVIGVAEREGQGGLQVYEFEYKVDSTRGGMKRIFSAAFVASKKLYLLNISHSDKPESPLDSHTREVLEEILHSFDAAPST